MPSWSGARTWWRGFFSRTRGRLRRHGANLLLAAAAAGLSYFIAGLFFASGTSFFAPIAAVVCTGLAAGQRIRRATEIVVGVALGLLAADLLVYFFGNGPIQLAVAVLLASSMAVVLLGAGPLMSNQAAIAAVLVVALMPVADNPFGPFGRLLEALIGGGVALALNAIVSPDPSRIVRHAAREITAGLGATLSEIQASLVDSDLARAEGALESTNAVAKQAQHFDEAIAAARESARLARYRRGTASHLHPLLTLRARVDILLSTMRGLARAAANAVRYGHEVPYALTDALEHLGSAFRSLGHLAAAEDAAERAQTEALEAARIASAVLDSPHDLTASVMVGQVRSAAIDVLRATGVEQHEAIRQLEDAAGRADRSA